MSAPQFRCATYDAIQTLVKEFGYPYHHNMQDWEYEVAKFDDIEKYFTKYESTDDDEIRFLLMEMILEASDHHPSLAAIWPRIQSMLRKNFSLHEYTVYYWCYSLSDDVEDMFIVSPYMRTLWKEMTGKDFTSTL